MEPIAEIEQAFNDALEDAGVELKGIAAAAVLLIRQRIGARRVYIPGECKQERNKLIIKLWRQKMTRKAISKEVEVSQTVVSQVIHRHLNPQKRKPQPTGFGSDSWNL